MPTNREIAERLANEILSIIADSQGGYIHIPNKSSVVKSCSCKITEALTAKDAERAEKLNTVRLTYGLLWHVHTDDKIVHQARRVLLNWLNDKDQQKIGIEEAKAILAKIGAGK